MNMCSLFITNEGSMDPFIDIPIESYITNDGIGMSRAESDNDNEDMFGMKEQRQQANARERYRTHSVNSAFTALRYLIPTEPINRKLSKIETLRLAKSYIEHLAALLTGDENFHGDQKRFLAIDSDGIRKICTFCIATRKN